MDTGVKGYDEFRDSLRAAVGVYFLTGDLPSADLDLPAWIPMSDIDKGADGEAVNLEKIRLYIPLFDSGVSLRISMYLAYDKEANVFYYIPRS